MKNKGKIKRTELPHGLPSSIGSPPPSISLHEALLLLLVVAEPLAFLPAMQNPFLVKKALISLVLVIACAAALFRSFREKKGLPFHFAPATVAALAFILWIAASTVFSGSRALSFGYLTDTLRYFLISLLAAAVFVDARRLRRFGLALILVAAITSVYGLLQYSGADFIDWTDTFEVSELSVSNRRVFSTFGHPNFFASFLAFSLPVIFLFTAAGKSLATRAAAGLTLLLSLASLALTLTRSSWFAGAFSLGLFALFLIVQRGRNDENRDSRRILKPGRVAIATVLMLLVFFSAVALLPQAVRERANVFQLTSSRTFQSRLPIWNAAAAMIRKNPLAGLGAGTFAYYFPFYREKDFFLHHDDRVLLRHAHNEFLQTGAELGVVGLALYGALLMTVLFSASAAIRKSRGERRLMLAALLAGFLAIVTSNMFDVNVRHVNSALFFWLSVGLISSGYIATGGRFKSVSLNKPAVIALTCVALGVFLSDLRESAAEIHLRKAERLVVSGSPPAASREALEAARLDRTDTRGYMLRGEILFSLGKFEEALEAYLMAETRNPGEPLLHYNKALFYYRMKEYVEGIDAISRSLQLHPTHAETAPLRFDLYRKRGRELIEEGQPEKALSYFWKLTSWHKLEPGGFIGLGNTLTLLYRYEEAAEAYRTALSLDPGNRTALVNLKQIEAAIAAGKEGK